MSYESINRIAQEIGTSRQNLSKMLKRHEEAPQPNEAGLYCAEEVKGFYYSRTHESKATLELKEQILEQKYRLVKAQADELESQYIPREDVEELAKGLNEAIDAFCVSFINKIARNEKEKEEGLKYAEAFFKSWKDTIKKFC